MPLLPDMDIVKVASTTRPPMGRDLGYQLDKASDPVHVPSSAAMRRLTSSCTIAVSTAPDGLAAAAAAAGAPQTVERRCGDNA